MFEYKKIDEKYFISSDKIKGYFGPFNGVFVKNKYLGDIDKSLIDEKSFPGYKYSIGIYNNNLFIIGMKGIEKII